MVELFIFIILLYSVSGTLENTDNVVLMEQQREQLLPKQTGCVVADPNSRFDCDPSLISSKTHCESKGCCWDPIIAYEKKLFSSSVSRPTGIPYCFYPHNGDGYHIEDITETKLGYHVDMRRDSPSGWPKDIERLSAEVNFETNNRLRVKIYDPVNKRYEVPIQTPKVTEKAKNPDYDISFQKVPFGLSVKRKSTGAVLFDSTMPGAPLIFADQFIQMSTHTGTGLVYGLGEHMTTLLLNATWQQIAMWNRDASPVFNENLYGSHPFYLNVEADGNAHGVFLMNSNAMDVDLQPLPALTFRTIGGILDFYIFTGSTADDVIRQYTAVIGQPQMPAYWSLGFHLCRYGVKSAADLQKIISRNMAIGLPYEVQWTDIDYMDNFRDWTYDKQQFSGLPGIVKDLHNNGMKYIVITDPGISNAYPGQYPPYDEGIRDNIFIKDSKGQPIVGSVWPGKTVFPDFTHPNATNWWYRQAKYLHDQLPYDGLWIDMNEPANGFFGSSVGCTNNTYDVPPYLPGMAAGSQLPSRTLCPSAQQYLSSHYNLHNMYGLHETMATDSVLKKILNKRSLVISRSTFPSQGHFGGHWTGDIHSTWQDLKYTIPAILKFNMFGIPMVGADICGFGDDTNEELCTRWMQLGAFYPFMRNHNAIGSKDQDPAAFSPAAQHAMRLVLELRYLMLPYLYTLFMQSHTQGSTVVRPLFFNFPNEQETYSIDEQFMWGDGLLVSPVTLKGASSVRAYMPVGIWYNMLTNKAISSKGGWVTIETPLNITNAHVRGGKIIPLQKPAVTTTVSRTQPFYLFVALCNEQKSAGELYWDDGESLGSFENGVYNLIGFAAGNGRLSSNIVKWGYDTDMILSSIAVYGVSFKPSNVFLNGKPITFGYDENQILSLNGFKVNLQETFTVEWK